MFCRQKNLFYNCHHKAKNENKKNTHPIGQMPLSSVGVDLFSRAAARQVSSARMSLTTVFGMGTGGPSSSLTPTEETLFCWRLSQRRNELYHIDFQNATPFFKFFKVFSKLVKKTLKNLTCHLLT